MAIKVKAKDADTLEEELEEWSLGVTFSTDQIKKDKSKRTTYLNDDLEDPTL